MLTRNTSCVSNHTLPPGSSLTTGIIPPAIAAMSLIGASASASQTPSSSNLVAATAAMTPTDSVSLPPKTGDGEPFHLASSFAPIPAKLVKRIQKLEYVDLRELLPDNLALSEKLEALPARSALAPTPEHREITKIVTWVSCLASYIAIVAQTHPERVCDMLAYMRLMVREGHKHGGTGWLKYDCIFRKNNPGPKARWDHLDPSLLTIVTNQGYPPRLPCHHCQEPDHAAHECALATLEQTKAGPVSIKGAGFSRRGKRPVPYEVASFNTRPQEYPPTSQSPAYPRFPLGQRPICISWNRGQCAMPNGCSYAHVCPSCNSESHKARDCSKTPPDSLFKRPPPQRAQS